MNDRNVGANASVAQSVMPDEPEPAISLTLPGDPPWKVLINGVPYVRRADSFDEAVDTIRAYQEIASAAGVTLRQAVWLFALIRGDRRLEELILPD